MRTFSFWGFCHYIHCGDCSKCLSCVCSELLSAGFPNEMRFVWLYHFCKHNFWSFVPAVREELRDAPLMLQNLVPISAYITGSHGFNLLCKVLSIFCCILRCQQWTHQGLSPYLLNLDTTQQLLQCSQERVNLSHTWRHLQREC